MKHFAVIIAFIFTILVSAQTPKDNCRNSIVSNMAAMDVLHPQVSVSADIAGIYVNAIDTFVRDITATKNGSLTENFNALNSTVAGKVWAKMSNEPAPTSGIGLEMYMSTDTIARINSYKRGTGQGPQKLMFTASQFSFSTGRVLVNTTTDDGTNNLQVNGTIKATSVTCSPTVTSGTATPGTPPVKIGDMYVNTSTKKIYVATGTASVTDWTILN